LLLGRALWAGGDFLENLDALTASIFGGFLSVSKSTTSLLLTSPRRVFLLSSLNDDGVARRLRWCHLLAKVASEHQLRSVMGLVGRVGLKTGGQLASPTTCAG
jgi:hypothetical protein